MNLEVYLYFYAIMFHHTLKVLISKMNQWISKDMTIHTGRKYSHRSHNAPFWNWRKPDG